jgi:N6-adenosine-specific RNA methylase IME4
MHGSVSPFDGLPLHQARVVLADPPWYFRTHSEKGWRKSAHAKYQCMASADIATLPVADLCAPDCLLLLWSTAPHLPQALSVLAAWGFVFKTGVAWAKQSRTGNCWAFGTGYLLRSAAEFFLIGTRGRITQVSRGSRNLIAAPIREHSRKPDEMYALIEATWPGPYVELFATHPREGWRQWGDGLQAGADQYGYRYGHTAAPTMVTPP